MKERDSEITRGEGERDRELKQTDLFWTKTGPEV